MKFSKNLLWTKLIITINSQNIDEDIIYSCFETIKDFEKKYSRFIENNYLDKLNTNKSSQANWELLSLIKLAQKVSKLTDWYFDITVLPLLENLWYWKNKSELEENIWYKNIEISWNKIILHNWVSIDLWALGKWFIIDKIFNKLDSIFDDFIINFWWDIRVKWTHTILLEDPNDNKKSIWQITLNNNSIASSTPFKRTTEKGHHLINPKNKNPSNEKLAIFITHKLSSFSDIFSTALFVSNIEKSIEILNKIKWLNWMIITKNGEIFKTKWFECKLNLN